MLTYNKTHNREFYKIDLTLKHRFWTDAALFSEYEQFFDPYNTKSNGNGWAYDNEEEARSLYTWAVLRWNNDGT